MEDNKNKDGFDTSGIIENTAGRRRKLTAYTPPPAPVENPPENIPDAVPEMATPETVEPVKEKNLPKSRNLSAKNPAAASRKRSHRTTKPCSLRNRQRKPGVGKLCISARSTTTVS